MRKHHLIVSVVLLLLFSACGNGSENKQSVSTSKKPAETPKTEVKAEEQTSPVVKEVEELIENYLLAYNADSEEAFAEKLTPLIHEYFLPHFTVDYMYHQLSDVSNVRFSHSKQLGKTKMETEATFNFVDGEGSPREMTMYVVAYFSQEEEGGTRLMNLYFYEDREEVENRVYTAYNRMTKNPPIVHFGGDLDLNNVVNPVGREDEEDPYEFSIFRQLVVLYHAQYLEVDAEEYNRKAKKIFHPEVLEDMLIADPSSPINGNLTTLYVNTIEHESFERTSDAYYYKGYYSFIFFDVEGNETPQSGEISAVFKQAEDGIRLVSLQFDQY